MIEKWATVTIRKNSKKEGLPVKSLSKELKQMKGEGYAIKIIKENGSNDNNN